MSIRDIINTVRRLDLESIYNTFLGLPPRQQTIGLISGIGAIILIVFMPVYIASNKLMSMENEIVTIQKQLNTVVQEVRDYTAAQAKWKAIERKFRRQTGDSLLTSIQRIADKQGLTIDRPAERGREVSEYYEEELVSFNLKSITLEQLVHFLHALESSSQRIIQIKEISIAPVYGNRTLLNAEFKQVGAYRLVVEGK